MDKESPTFCFDPNMLTPELKVELSNIGYDSGEIARERKRAAHKQQDKWPSFIGAKERRAPRPPKEWEIEPFFYRKNRVILYGAPGSGKSVILMHMGVCLAAGISWLGRYGISEPRNVLYIDKENGEDLAIERCNRIEATLGVDVGERLKIWADPGFMMNERDPHELLARFDRIGWKADVILIDGFRRVLDGEENSSDDINVFWNNTAALRKEGITIVLLHHTNKADNLRGSIDIEAGTDKIFKLTNDKNDICTIKPEKERAGKTAPTTLAVRIEGGTEEDDPLNVVFIREEARQQAADSGEDGKLGQACKMIVGYLEQFHDKQAATAEILLYLKVCDISDRTGQAALKYLESIQRIDRSKKGKPRLIDSND